MPMSCAAAVDHHRRQDRVAHAAMEAGVELLVADLLALEVLGQHVVVGLGRGLEQLVAAARDLVGELGRDRDLGALALLPDVRLAVNEIDVAAERVGLADGQVQWRDLVAEDWRAAHRARPMGSAFSRSQRVITKSAAVLVRAAQARWPARCPPRRRPTRPSSAARASAAAKPSTTSAAKSA